MRQTDEYATLCPICQGEIERMVQIFLSYSLIGSGMGLGAMGQGVVTIFLPSYWQWDGVKSYDYHLFPSLHWLFFRATIPATKQNRTLTKERLQKIRLKTRSYLSDVH
jgi:hypothetical protein